MNKKQTEKKEKRDKQDKIILAQTDKMIKDFASQKAERHVKEPTEPLFKEILQNFTLNYGKTVVVNINEEILKELIDDI